MIKNLKIVIILLLSFVLIACGSGSSFPPDVPTQTDPLIETISPNPASAGDDVSIKGIGFSDAYINNIIIIGDETPILASDYILLDPPEGDFSVEEIRFILPKGFVAGKYDLIVMVHDVPSEAVEFEVK